ncbi:type II toxin-antitoxin system VapB family antitoxin [bacterium]|nr:type II toxin-antitoxin system VapB family antitoxin [bacterium]MCI0615335.1 type II toxin-antitoxin system VapB family antitoxin [bacterium]
MRTARLFKNGQSQAVRLPKEFRFEGDKVFIKKWRNGVVLLPYDDSWETLFAGLDLFTEDFMKTRKQGKQKKRPQLE